MLVSPIKLREFAKGLGWVPTDKGYSHKLYVLEHAQFPKRQLVFPMHPDAPDYREAIDLVIDKLAELHRTTAESIRSSAQIVQDETRALRKSELASEETYFATVERLEGVMGSDGHRQGDVVLALLPHEGEPLKAKVYLTPEQYLVADRAHMTDGAYIKVTGKLQPGRQPRQLVDLTQFVEVR